MTQDEVWNCMAGLLCRAFDEGFAMSRDDHNAQTNHYDNKIIHDPVYMRIREDKLADLIGRMLRKKGLPNVLLDEPRSRARKASE